jgi:hypothetical protein
VLPEEVRALLDRHAATRSFTPEVAYAETLTPLDSYRGNTRNSDLLVVGAAGEQRVLLDLEGKADESFGGTIAETVRAAETRLQENPASKGLARVQELCQAVLGRGPGGVGELRYQLLHGMAAAVIRAGMEGADRAVFLVHEFQGAQTQPFRCERNTTDLEAFVAALGGDPGAIRRGELLGPLFLPGGGRVSREIPLYVGKATCHLA